MKTLLRKSGVGRLIDEWGTIRRLLFHTPAMGTPSTDYEAYWRERLAKGPGRLNAFQLDRAQWIAVRVLPGSRVLDVGCGDGGILAHLRDRKGIVPMGADLSPYVLEFLKARGMEPVRVDLSETGLASLPGADHVLFLEVLEHMQNPEEILKQALSKASVSVFFSVPNTGYFPYRLRLLGGRVPMQWRVHPGEHVRFWTLADMRWWLDQLGLGGRYELKAYRGIPVLNRIWPAMFGMGLICEVKK
jgi:methionine biosynthesis protein MetW